MKERKMWTLLLPVGLTFSLFATAVSAEEVVEDALVEAAVEEAAAEAVEEAATEAVEEAATEAVEDALVEAAVEEAAAEEAPVEEMDYATMMALAAEAAALEAEEDAALAGAAQVQGTGGSIVINGFEWGPGVTGVIVELPEEVNAQDIDLKTACVNTNSTRRQVLDALNVDEEGKEVEEATNSVCFTLNTNYAVSGSPFVYDFMVTFQNHWAETYPVIVSFAAGEKTYGFNADLINNRRSPDSDVFTDRGEFNGDYVNPMTGETDNLTLRYAAYEPAELVEDGVANPLIIWLHGQGEGGVDPDIVLLGNETSALAAAPIQAHFTTEGGANGAYVLGVQCETYWMDGGDGTNSSGDIDSRYTQILMDTIKSYVDAHEDVDVNRIYLGGCSNGGFMTMNMLVSFPDYWAAAYPNCEAYAYNKISANSGEGTAMGGVNEVEAGSERWMTDEKIEAIKNIPIWFAQSADDTIVDPKAFGLPTYQALLKAGATNAWFSFFETVQGIDDPTATYMGHWVWCYLFNDAITAAQDPAAVIDAEDELFGFVPSNEGGGSFSPQVDGVTFTNIFDWLNAQVKA